MTIIGTVAGFGPVPKEVMGAIDAFLPKPFSVEQLEELLQTAVHSQVRRPGTSEPKHGSVRRCAECRSLVFATGGHRSKAGCSLADGIASIDAFEASRGDDIGWLGTSFDVFVLTGSTTQGTKRKPCYWKERAPLGSITIC